MLLLILNFLFVDTIVIFFHFLNVCDDNATKGRTLFITISRDRHRYYSTTLRSRLRREGSATKTEKEQREAEQRDIAFENRMKLYNKEDSQSVKISTTNMQWQRNHSHLSYFGTNFPVRTGKFWPSTGERSRVKNCSLSLWLWY